MENLSLTDLAIAAAGLVVLVAYAALIVAPAWSSYGRVWEKLAASFLTVYILLALLVVGGLVGFALVWSYDRWA